MGGKKKAGNEMSAKTEKKLKNAAIEDKTFGLKNKNKSAKVQQYVATVKNQTLHGNQRGGADYIKQKEFAAKKEKKEKASQDALLASLFKNAQNLKAKGGVDATNNKAIDMYQDQRFGTPDMPDTIITCLHFLEAVENEKFGWRWECPNGQKCEYRHQLPEGYVITSKKEREKMKKEAEERAKDETTIEEKIEAERSALRSDDLTLVTKESFFAWKDRRAAKKQQALEDELKQAQIDKVKAKANLKGKNSIMNGRALFSYNPDMFVDDEAAAGAQDFEEEKPEESKVDQALFAAEEVDEDVDFD